MRLLLVIVFVLFTGCLQPTPEERQWMYAGINVEKKKIWELYGVTLEGAKTWRGYKLPIEKARDWLNLGFSSHEAHAWNAHALTASQSKAWNDTGIDAQSYPHWAALGIPLEQIKAWHQLQLPYYAVRILNDLKFTPKTAKTFISQEFSTFPRVFQSFNTEIYHFSATCKELIESNDYPIQGIKQQCIPYRESAAHNKILGHILDMQKDAEALEHYLSELRSLKITKDEINRNLMIKIDQSIEQGDTRFFDFIFTKMHDEPTEREMAFIEKHRLDYEEHPRYLSYSDINFWLDKEQKEKKAHEALLAAQKIARKKAQEEAHQKALALAKKREILAQKRALELQRIERKKKMRAECGEPIAATMGNQEKALIEGTVLFTVGTKESNIYGFGVQNSVDNVVYYIRDPHDKTKAAVGSNVAWQVTTVERRMGLDIKEDRTASLNQNAADKFNMAKFEKKCLVD